MYTHSVYVSLCMHVTLIVYTYKRIHIKHVVLEMFYAVLCLVVCVDMQCTYIT